MRVAIFGGSFDPPHNGHKAIIEKVLETLQIDLLIVLVAYKNPLKSHYRINAQKRFIWMQTLCNEYEKVICSDYELRKNIITTTIESVRYFKNLYKIETLYFVLGQDNFLQVPKWNDFASLRIELSFVVIARKFLNPNHENLNKDLQEKVKDLHICEQFAKKYMLKMQYLQFSYPYSSSLIMQDIKRYQEEIPESIRKSVIESYATINQTNKKDINDTKY